MSIMFGSYTIDEPFGGHVRLTYDDFVRFPDDGMRHELLDGAHHVSPSPNTKHQRISLNLAMAIGNWLDEHAIGKLFCAPFDVVLSHFDVVEPDLLYLSNERAEHALTAQHVRGVPELIIEIGSPSTMQRDETLKRQTYERCGVSEYWIVDPAARSVRIYLQSGGAFAKPVELSCETNDVLTSPRLPGFELPLARIFRD